MPIELRTLTDGGQTPTEIAREVAAFIGAARTSLDMALYDVRFETDAGALVLATLLAAQQRGVAIRLAYNVDHPGPIPVPPPPETKPEAIPIAIRRNAELMLRELADALGAMPVVLARAVEQLVRSPSRAKSSQELATMAGMTLRTLYRHLTPVGLQPRHLIVSARLLRAYIFLRSPGSRLKEVALKLGYADPSHLSEQLRVWTGLSPKEIQRTLTAAEFVQRIADHLRRVDADAEDEVEPV